MRAPDDRSQRAEPRGCVEEGMQEEDRPSVAGMGFLPGYKSWDFSKGFGENEGRTSEAVREALLREDGLQRFQLLGGELPVGDASGHLPEAAVVVGGLPRVVERRVRLAPRQRRPQVLILPSF